MWVVMGSAIVALALGYRWASRGGLTARQHPSAVEGWVAGKLVAIGIDRETRERKNPLRSDDASAGRGLYERSCLTCHGADGAGATETARGLFPPAMSLTRAALAEKGRTDGELFFFIRNGVRNTGMPAWSLPDREIWELVSYIRRLPAKPVETPTLANATYLGSASCRECHSSIYDRWVKTPMANVVRDPRAHPDAIMADFAKADPLVGFGVADVALVYGSRWKQRYFKRVDDDYFVLPAQWDVTHAKWRPYFAKDDWWAPLYPPDNMQRPTSALCDGCHSVNYDIETKKVTEWNVGCEKCHGPGSLHAKERSAATIASPARMDDVAANDVCISCHSQGRPLHNPIAGKSYDWPVGYEAMRRLSDFWALEEPELGKTTFTHFADGTAHKNRMQGNDYVQSAMYTHGVTCSTCHDAHGTEHPSSLRKPANELCLDCHSAGSPNGPRAPTLAEHTHHREGSAGNACISCHMPKIAQTIGDVNVRSHTFRFVSPATTTRTKTPNACNVCHADKSAAWSSAALASWRERSPWR